MPEKVKTITVENLKELTDEEFKQYSKLATKEYYRRLKVKLLAWWDKAKVGGTRLRDISLFAAGVAVFVLAIKEILK